MSRILDKNFGGLEFLDTLYDGNEYGVLGGALCRNVREGLGGRLVRAACPRWCEGWYATRSGVKGGELGETFES